MKSQKKKKSPKKKKKEKNLQKKNFQNSKNSELNQCQCQTISVPDNMRI